MKCETSDLARLKQSDMVEFLENFTSDLWPLGDILSIFIYTLSHL